MLHIQAPVLVKIRDGITVNLSQSFSQAIERQVPQKKLKKEYKGNPTEAKPEDFEITGKLDTVSFWFADGRSLAYRVGHEFTQADFDRVEKQMISLEFRTKDDGKSSDVKATTIT